MSSVQHKLSESRKVLPSPIVINGHTLSFVQSLLPHLSAGLIMVYASSLDPDTFFYVRLLECDIDLDGGETATFACFQTDKKTISDVIESKLSVFILEARSSFTCTFNIQIFGDIPLYSVLRSEVPGTFAEVTHIKQLNSEQKNKILCSIDSPPFSELFKETLSY